MCGRVGLARRGDDCGDKKGEAISCGGGDGGPVVVVARER